MRQRVSRWRSTRSGGNRENLLFNTIDALVGSSIGTEQPAQVKAYIVDSTINASGALSLSAQSDAQLKAGVANRPMRAG